MWPSPKRAGSDTPVLIESATAGAQFAPVPQVRKKERKWGRSVPSASLRPPLTGAHQALPSMGFSRQEYWSGLPFPSPGDLPDPGIEPESPAWRADALLSEPKPAPRPKLRKIRPPPSSPSRLITLPAGKGRVGRRTGSAKMRVESLWAAPTPQSLSGVLSPADSTAPRRPGGAEDSGQRRAWCIGAARAPRRGGLAGGAGLKAEFCCQTWLHCCAVPSSSAGLWPFRCPHCPRNRGSENRPIPPKPETSSPSPLRPAGLRLPARSYTGATEWVKIQILSPSPPSARSPQGNQALSPLNVYGCWSWRRVGPGHRLQLFCWSCTLLQLLDEGTSSGLS